MKPFAENSIFNFFNLDLVYHADFVHKTSHADFFDKTSHAVSVDKTSHAGRIAMKKAFKRLLQTF